MGLLVSIVLAVMMLLVPQQALAKDYEMTAVDIEASVNTDGSLDVVEKRTFSFEGKFNGVYWRISEGTYQGRELKVTDIRAGMTQLDGQPAEKQFEESDSEDNQTFQVQQDDGVKQIKLFNKVRNGSATYKISYRVQNAVSVWSDCAELYWKFVSDGWDNVSKNVTCRIVLPVPANDKMRQGDNVRAWGHGNLLGSVHEDNNPNAILYKTPEVGTSEFAEARVIFPTSWVSQVKPSGTTHLDTVLQEEKEWAEQANARREAARERIARHQAFLRSFTQAYHVLFFGVLPASVVVTAVVAFMLYRRYKRLHTPQFDDTYFRDAPTKDHPVLYTLLMRNGHASEQDFVTALMHLSAQKVIKVAPALTKAGKPRKDEELIILVLKSADELTDPLDKQTYQILQKVYEKEEKKKNKKKRKGLLGSIVDAFTEDDEYDADLEDAYEAAYEDDEADVDADGIAGEKTGVGAGEFGAGGIATGGVLFQVSSKAFNRAARTSPKTYTSWFESWKAKAEAQALERNFFVDEHNNHKGIALALEGIVLIVFLLTFGAGLYLLIEGVPGVDGFLFASGIAITIVVMVVMHVRLVWAMDELSSEACETRAKLRAFERWVRDFTRLKEAVPGDIVLWNRILVLAVALGVSQQVIEELTQAMLQYVPNVDQVDVYPWFYTSPYSYRPLYTSFDSAVSQAHDVAAASSLNSLSGGSFGGGGSGFSGSGGGGFGGGGGGGAF